MENYNFEDMAYNCSFGVMVDWPGSHDETISDKQFRTVLNRGRRDYGYRVLIATLNEEQNKVNSKQLKEFNFELIDTYRGAHRSNIYVYYYRYPIKKKKV